MLAMEKATIFKGKAVYLGSVLRSIKEADKWRHEKSTELFVAALSGPNEFAAERSVTGETFTDIAVDDQRCYVVSYCWKKQGRSQTRSGDHRLGQRRPQEVVETVFVPI